MSGIDPERAQQVWQRVRGESQPPRDRVAEQMQGLVEHYSILNRQTRGRVAELLSGARRDLACVRGIARMQGRPTDAPGSRQTGENLMKECCRRELELMKALKKAEGEFEPIFEYLHENARARCARVLAMIGSQER